MSEPRRHPLRQLLRDEEFLFLGLAAAVGVGGAIVGRAFQLAVMGLGNLVYGADPVNLDNIVQAAAAVPWWHRLGMPIVGGCVAGLAIWLIGRAFKMEKGAGGAGIADVMEMQVKGGAGPSIVGAVRGATAALIGIGTGHSAGREGPMCQLATALAGRLARATRLSPDRRRMLVVAGVCAGLAAAYNAPLAATIFALEILVLWKASYIPACFVASTFAAGAMQLMGRIDPIYAIPHDLFTDPAALQGAQKHLQLALASWWDVPLLLLLGVLGGVVGAAFLQALRLTSAGVRRLDWPAPVWLSIGGLGVGLIGCALPWVYGNGYETVREFVHANPRFDFAPLAIAAIVVGVAKIAATSASVGTGMPGGVFTPTLVVGAAVGAAMSVASGALAGQPVAPALYVLVGMAVVLAGTTNAPILAVVMVVELTGNWTVLLWLPIPAFIAVAVAHRLARDSIYVASLRRRGIEWKGDLEETALRSLRVRDIMRHDVPLLPAGLPAADLRRALADSRQHTLFVGTSDGTFIGGIDLHHANDLFATDPADIDGLVVAQDLAAPMPAVYPDDSLISVNEKLWFRDLGHLPVLESPERPRFLGIVTRRDLLGVIDHEILQRDRLVGRVRHDDGAKRYVELAPRHRLEEIEVPAGLIGKTIAEADLTSRFGITVLAVSRVGPDGEAQRRPPEQHCPFERGDRVVVLGTAEAIRKLRGAG